MNMPEHRAEASEVARSLIDEIVLTLDESENRLVADLCGVLAGILAIAATRSSDSHINGTALVASGAALSEVQTFKSAPRALRWLSWSREWVRG